MALWWAEGYIRRRWGRQEGYVPPEVLKRIDQAVIQAGLKWAERHKPQITFPDPLNPVIRWVNEEEAPRQ